MTRSPVANARDRLNEALAESARPALSCSFQPGGLAVLHLLRSVGADVPVLFVDTGFHFAETLEFRDHVVRQWDLDLRVQRSARHALDQQRDLGSIQRTNPDLCCQTRKSDPLFDALADHDLWITGLRRDQAESRAQTSVSELRVLPRGGTTRKLNPIVDWTLAELQAYTAINEIPTHPLLDQGYPSIGCAPCTARTDGDDLRAGRWNGNKVECGLHTGLRAVGGPVS